MGGDDHRSNLVELTAEEHYVAHQLLTKMHPGVRGLATAAVRMAKQCVGNKAYGWLRRRHARAVAELHTGNKYNVGRVRPAVERARISATMSGLPKSAETRSRMSQAQCGNSKALGLKRGPQSPEHKDRYAAGRRGKPLSEDHRRKISEAKLGKTKSAETRLRMSIAQRVRIAMRAAL